MSPGALLKPNVKIKMGKMAELLQNKQDGDDLVNAVSQLPAPDLLTAKQFSFSPGLQADGIQKKDSVAKGRLRAQSGAFGANSRDNDNSLNEFASSQGLLFQQDQLNTNLPNMDLQDDQNLDEPPSNITPLCNHNNYHKIRLLPVKTSNNANLFRPNAKSKEAEQESLVYRQSNDDMVKYQDLLEKIDEENASPINQEGLEDIDGQDKHNQKDLEKKSDQVNESAADIGAAFNEKRSDPTNQQDGNSSKPRSEDK